MNRLRLFLVVIGPKHQPRLSFEAYASDSLSCTNQHLCLVALGERLEIRAL